MQALPKSVKIGPLVYDMREEARLTAMGLYGQLVRTESAIELLPDLPPGMQEITIWHEIVHEILEQIGVKGEETVINRLAYGIVGVLKDNPGLVK
jgi:hypothetical protein